MTNVVGRSPTGPGCSAEPESCSTVSAIPASIPNADQIAYELREIKSTVVAARDSYARNQQDREYYENQLRTLDHAANLVGGE